MKIIIKETGVTETLEIIDPTTGVNYIADFIGNAGALIDGQFEYDDETDEWSCDQDTFDWWDRVVDENQELNYRMQDLIKEHGQDAIYDAIAGAGDVDLGDSAGSINQALDEYVIQYRINSYIEQAQSGDSPEISSGVWLCLGSDLNCDREPDDTSPLLIADQLYIHTNDGYLAPADPENIRRHIE